MFSALPAKRLPNSLAYIQAGKARKGSDVTNVVQFYLKHSLHSLMKLLPPLIRRFLPRLEVCPHVD